MPGKSCMSALSQRPRVPTKATQVCAERQVCRRRETASARASLQLFPPTETWRSASPRKERQRISDNHSLFSGKQMETPKYYECMNPVLTALREAGGTLTNDEIVDAVANIMHLPDDVMNRKQQGHNMGEVAYRIAWAKSYLKKAGYLTQSTRGVWVLTAEGKSADAVDVRAILTDVRKDYVTRRTEKEPLPTVLGATVEGASAAIAEVEEELGWKQ